MNIKTINHLVFLCFIHSIGLQAQTNQEDLLKAARKAVVDVQSVQPLSDLIASGQLTERRVLAMAYMSRAKMNRRFDKRHWRNYVWEEPIRDSLTLSILADYEQAIETCPRCAVVAQKERYEFLQKIAPKTGLFKDDLAKIKAVGYKPDQEGVILGLHTWQRGGMWLGGSIAPFAKISPFYRLRLEATAREKKQYISNTPLNINIMALSYSRKFDENLNDISFSVYQIYAPIVLNLETFGVQFGKDAEGKTIAPRWYYRPEVGFGIGHLSLSFGYDLFFKKAARRASDKFFVQLRYAFIVSKH